MQGKVCQSLEVVFLICYAIPQELIKAPTTVSQGHRPFNVKGGPQRPGVRGPKERATAAGRRPYDRALTSPGLVTGLCPEEWNAVEASSNVLHHSGLNLFIHNQPVLCNSILPFCFTVVSQNNNHSPPGTSMFRVSYSLLDLGVCLGKIIVGLPFKPTHRGQGYPAPPLWALSHNLVEVS